MSTGLFVNRSQNGRHGRRVLAAVRWSPARIDALCDLVADGCSLSSAARELGVSKNAAIGQFTRIRKSMGWQAQ